MNNNNVAKSIKVFVTQYSDYLNFRLAEQHGEVVFLSEKEYRAEPALASANDKIRDEILNGLVDYVAGIDHILLTGSPIPTLIVGAFMNSRIGEHKVLKWNNQTKSYDIVKLRVN